MVYQYDRIGCRFTATRARSSDNGGGRQGIYVSHDNSIRLPRRKSINGAASAPLPNRSGSDLNIEAIQHQRQLMPTKGLGRLLRYRGL